MVQPSFEEACCELARRYLERFGPATVEDLQWWTGWNATTTRTALSDLPLLQVDLHGTPGIALRDVDPSGDAGSPARRYTGERVAALLPVLDPTPMGWRHRDWFMGIEARHLFDRAGNIGPTIWLEGEIIGSWACVGQGQVHTAVLADRGRDSERSIRDAAGRLRDTLDGFTVTPAARTPLERTQEGRRTSASSAPSRVQTPPDIGAGRQAAKCGAARAVAKGSVRRARQGDAVPGGVREPRTGVERVWRIRGEVRR